MNRSVLIVTPFFAPQNHSAMFRAYKLAKYLPRFGWKPIVLTVDTQYLYNEDPSLIPGLPPEVEVVHAPYVEPTLRGLRMALGGRDRTFKAMKESGKAMEESGATQSAASNRSRKARARHAYEYVVKNWFQVPDAYWTWAKTATTIGNKIIRDRHIDVAYTTAPPYSSLVIGKALQNTGVKWVCDFRDPLAYTQRLSSKSAGSYQRQRKIVQTALENADAVTVAASSFTSIYHDMFGNQGVDPVFIPTGMDEALIGPESCDPVERNPHLLFAGEYLPDYDTAFLEAFAATLKYPEVTKTGIKLLVVGTLELNRTRLMPLLDRFALREHVEFLDQKPQRDVYKLLSRARAGVLVPGPRAYWWTTFAKMTDCIGMRKPVLAVVPDPSEARTALTRSGLGIFLDGSPENRTKILTDFLLGKHKLPVPDDNECERYTAHRQVQSFVELFESLSVRSPGHKQWQ
jgi:glycosyltransferase involved in cell wall biosynthesis